VRSEEREALGEKRFKSYGKAKSSEPQNSRKKTTTGGEKERERLKKGAVSIRNGGESLKKETVKTPPDESDYRKWEYVTDKTDFDRSGGKAKCGTRTAVQRGIRRKSI